MKYAAWAVQGVPGLHKAAQMRGRLPSMSKEESKNALMAADNGEVGLMLNWMQRHGLAGR
jgi:hypothetical protein